MNRNKRRLLGITMGFLVAMLVVTQVFAWQASAAYGHASRFGGEADSGWHRGQISISGSRRDVTAGDDNIKWSSSTASWANSHRTSSERAAIVYHAFSPNSNGGCGDIEIIRSTWVWSNLPAWEYWQKDTCVTGGNWNETRFLVKGSITANSPYWTQEVFNDWRYEFGGGTRAAGEITVDSYWDKDDILAGHKKVYNDYHGKFCITGANDIAYPPTNGNC